jgi:hypothetical protein
VCATVSAAIGEEGAHVALRWTLVQGLRVTEQFQESMREMSPLIEQGACLDQIVECLLNGRKSPDHNNPIPVIRKEVGLAAQSGGIRRHRRAANIATPLCQ